MQAALLAPSSNDILRTAADALRHRPSSDDRAPCRDVRKQIGAFASPDVIHWAPALPKTRSGKIMRRILRKIASGEYDQLGDTSTLADPSIVDTLIDRKPE